MLTEIKKRCGIPAAITVYDDELTQLIKDALLDMQTAGIPERLLTDNGADTDPRVLTAVTCFCKAYRGDDRSDTDTYISLYRARVHKLMLEEPDE